MKIKYKNKLIVAAVIVVGLLAWKSTSAKDTKKSVTEMIEPSRGDIEIFISATGSVQPQNRLEIKPPINGRIEDILVHEGDPVKKGQVVAWMSSTERAALLDAAHTKGDEALRYWEDAYKATPLIAPIDAQVIVRSVEPGQTVTSANPIVVLSDKLIVKAQVDETDIGRIAIGQKAVVSLDAYPREKVKARVEHISYESSLINNVTMYEVNILPESVPPIFRSGMTANVSIVEDSRENVYRLPVEAIRREKKGVFVLVDEGGVKGRQLREIETGLEGEEFVEVISGLNEGETVVVEKMSMGLPKKRSGGNSPFMPGPRR